MLRCIFGMVAIEGSKSLVDAEFSTLAYALKDKGILTREELHESVDRAFDVSNEDLMKADSKIDEAADKIAEIITRLIEEE